MTLVSIITPSFNQAPYIERTIESVLTQDHPHIEYIVIDGGSTDDSVEIIRRHAARIAYWTSEKDAGQADAINKGFVHARGEIIAWLNSDDYYLPGTISSVARIFRENPDVDLVYGNMLAVDEQDQVFNSLAYRQLNLQDLLCFQIIGQPAVFMRGTILQHAKLDPSYHFLLDHHLWIQIARQANILYTDQTWAAARYHAMAKNRAKAAEFGREAFRILEWAAKDETLAPVLARVSGRATASAHRVDSRYKVDAGMYGPALLAWGRAFLIHMPTALSRLNLLFSSILGLLGWNGLRQFILNQRKHRHGSLALKEHE